MENQAYRATPEEIAANRIRCQKPHCKHRAFLRDWAGWQWCWRHWIWSTRSHVEGRDLLKWLWYVKNTRVFL